MFGARQTGKTTLVKRFNPDVSISFIQPSTRVRYEKNPSVLKGELEAFLFKDPTKKPLVVLDEVQKVPEIMDVVQDLIDREIAQFILTGSSARKLRRQAQLNLLPGRVNVLHLEPFSLSEYPAQSLEDRLLDGSLPGIVQVDAPADRERDLEDYVTSYLEEEIRAEAIVRRLGTFARFLELSASESGQIINLRKLASEINVAHTTIASYYQILEDCLILHRVEPISSSATRKRLTKSDRYLFFDMGVRRLAAHEGRAPPRTQWGTLFEQWVGLEIIRHMHTARLPAKLRFWRDPDGPEVDWVVERDSLYLPVEVKWSETPTLSDARHLQCFMREYKTAGMGYIVCRTPNRFRLADNVLAVPWQTFVDDIHLS